MLGRLRMTIDDCINAYATLSDRVFQEKRYRVNMRGNVRGRFDSAELESAIKKIIVDQGFDENELLKDKPDAICKVWVAL